jgi:uncharacterized protein (TIGR01777 family)
MLQPKLVLVGGNGFLGRHLATHFKGLGYQVVSISRTGSGDVRWDARTRGPWAQELEGADLLVNLAGRSVDCRYNEANRREILASRTESTRILGAAVAACTRPPRVWLNSSTATIYADTQGEAPANTEVAGIIGEGFSVDIARAWEVAFDACPAPATRKVALRTSIVLGPDGGAFPVMAQLARFGLCSPQGSGIFGHCQRPRRPGKPLCAAPAAQPRLQRAFTPKPAPAATPAAAPVAARSRGLRAPHRNRVDSQEPQSIPRAAAGGGVPV